MKESSILRPRTKAAPAAGSFPSSAYMSAPEFSPTSGQSNIHSGNEYLPKNIQSKYEDAYGQDFSNVQMKKNSSLAENMGVPAFTKNNHIHFAPGAFQPDSKKGQHIIGHELAHISQQKNGQIASDLNLGNYSINNDPSHENEADQMSANAAKDKKTANHHTDNQASQGASQPIQAFGLGDAWNWAKKKVKSGVKGAKKVIKNGVNFGKKLGGSVLGLGKKGLKFAKKVFNKIKGTISGGVKRVAPFVAPITKFAKRATNALITIVKNPIGFLGNLIKGIKNGTIQFGKNLVNHIREGLFNWLSSALSSAGIDMPEAFDIKSIMQLAFQIISLTWKTVAKKLMALFNPTSAIVRVAQTVYDVGHTIIFKVFKRLIGATQKASNITKTTHDTSMDVIKNI